MGIKHVNGIVSRVFAMVLVFCFVSSLAAEPLVTFVYPYDHEVIVSVRSLDNELDRFSVMLGDATQEMGLPLQSGRYEILSGRIEDFTVAQRRVADFSGTESVKIQLDSVDYSPAYKLEQARSDYLRAEAVSGTIRSQQKSARTFSLLSLTGALLAGIGTGAAFYLGTEAYEAYQSSTTSADASEQRSQVETAAGIAFGAAAFAVTGVVAALVSQLKKPKDTAAQEALDISIRALRDARAGISAWPEYVSDEFVLESEGAK